jgi:uncharacterized protein YceK
MNPSSTTLVVIAVVVLAGCTGVAPTADSSGADSVKTTERTTTEATQTTRATTTTIVDWPPLQYELESGPRAYPSAPSNLTASAVRQTAEQYESAHVYNTLAGAEKADEVDVPRNGASEVLGRAHDGVFVEVTLRYSFEEHSDGNVTSIYDGQTQATYFVNTTTVWRVDVEQPVKY